MSISVLTIFVCATGSMMVRSGCWARKESQMQ